MVHVGRPAVVFVLNLHILLVQLVNALDISLLYFFSAADLALIRLFGCWFNILHTIKIHRINYVLQQLRHISIEKYIECVFTNVRIFL